MKKFAFALAGAAALTLAACSSGEQDTLENADMNQTVDMNVPDANAAADAEAAALGTQQEQLESENALNAVEDNATNPSDAEEQNVAGM